MNTVGMLPYTHRNGTYPRPDKERFNPYGQWGRVGYHLDAAGKVKCVEVRYVLDEVLDEVLDNSEETIE